MEYMPESIYDQLILLLMFAYLVYGVITRQNPRAPIAIALVLLVACGFILTYESMKPNYQMKKIADEIAVLAYELLVVGVIMYMFEFIRNPEKFRESDEGMATKGEEFVA